MTKYYDFEGGNYTDSPAWTVGTGSITVDDEVVKEGSYSARNSTSGNAAYFYNTNSISYDGNTITWNIWVRYTTTSGNIDTSRFDNASSAYIAALHIVSGTWTGYHSGGSSSLTGTDNTPDANVWYRLKITHNNSTNKVNYYVYDTGENLLCSLTDQDEHATGDITKISLYFDADAGKTYYDFIYLNEDPPNKGVFDDFESNSFSGNPSWSATRNTWSVQSTTKYEGNYGLKGEQTEVNSAVITNSSWCNNEVNFWVYFTSDSLAEIIDYAAGNVPVCNYEGSSSNVGAIDINDDGEWVGLKSGGSEILVGSDNTPDADTWYRVRFVYASNKVNYYIYNTSGTELCKKEDLTPNNTNDLDSITVYGYGDSTYYDYFWMDEYPGPESYEENLTDVVTLADSVTKKVSKTLSDSLTLAEVFDKTYNAKKTLSEQLTLYDADTKLFSKTVSDALSLEDVKQTSVDKSLSDAITLVDSKALKTSLVKEDVLTIAEATAKSFSITLSDSVSLNEETTKSSSKTISNSLELVDEINRNTSKSFSDALTLAEEVSVKTIVIKTLTDSMSLSDEVGPFSVGKALSDELTLYDADYKDFFKVISEAFSIEDEVNKSSSRSLASAFSLEDSVSKSGGKVVSDELSLDEVLTKTYSGVRILSDALVLSDSSFNAFSRVLSDSLTLEDAVGRGFTKTVSDELSLSDSVLKEVKRVVEDSVVLQDVLTKSLSKTLSDSLTIAEEAAAGPEKTLLDSLTLSDASTKKVSKVLVDSIAFAEQLTPTQFIELTDSLTLSDAKTISPGKVLSDSLSIAESISGSYSVVLSDSLALDDEISSEQKEFLSDMQTDFDTILSDVPFEEQVKWERVSETEDEMGHVDSSTTSQKQILLIIQPITEKDRDLLGRGISVSSHMKAYARHVYRVGSELIGIKTGDFLTRANGDQYIVEKIIGKYAGDSVEVFRKLILRAVDDD